MRGSYASDAGIAWMEKNQHRNPARADRDRSSTASHASHRSTTKQELEPGRRPPRRRREETVQGDGGQRVQRAEAAHRVGESRQRWRCEPESSFTSRYPTVVEGAPRPRSRRTSRSSRRFVQELADIQHFARSGRRLPRRSVHLTASFSNALSGSCSSRRAEAAPADPPSLRPPPALGRRRKIRTPRVVARARADAAPASGRTARLRARRSRKGDRSVCDCEAIG